MTLLQSQINVLRKTEGRIGERRSSILPLEAFQELYGKSWVLRDRPCIPKKCDYDPSAPDEGEGKHSKLF